MAMDGARIGGGLGGLVISSSNLAPALLGVDSPAKISAEDIAMLRDYHVADAGAGFPQSSVYYLVRLEGYLYCKKNVSVGATAGAGRHATSGWKFHVAVAFDEANIQGAYTALVPILIKHGIATAKFAYPSAGSGDGDIKGVKELPDTVIKEGPYAGYQCGKAICIYAFNSRDVNWEDFVKEAEEALNDAGVRPDVAPMYRYKDDKKNIYFSKVEEPQVGRFGYFYYANDALVLTSPGDATLQKLFSDKVTRVINPGFPRVVGVHADVGLGVGVGGGASVAASVGEVSSEVYPPFSTKTFDVVIALPPAVDTISPVGAAGCGVSTTSASSSGTFSFMPRAILAVETPPVSRDGATSTTSSVISTTVVSPS